MKMHIFIIHNQLLFLRYFTGIDLGYVKAKNAIAKHFDDNDALKQGVIDNVGRCQDTTFINKAVFTVS